MDSQIEWVIPLAEAADSDERFIGGKAAKLAQLARAGFRVPDGFCITTAAYEHFLEEGNLANVIRMELGRKPFESMRWEEIWDTALRVRSAFLATPIPATVSHEIGIALEKLGADKAVAVRSSAPGEDSANRSFAGLHESLVGLAGKEAVLDAVRLVWASLWSDAALLYRHELSLDPARSRMAVIVQEVITEDRSGVAFGRDPRDVKKDRAIVEAVPGPGSDLVDGAVDPDRWILKRSSGKVLEWRHGDREKEDSPAPILEANDLNVLYHTLMDVESLFEWPPDIEWTGQAERFTLLQARPITTASPEPDDQRTWYLTLRPGMQRLRTLRKRVADELIPQLEDLGEQFATEALGQHDDERLACAIEERLAAVQKWKQIYWDEFIPFAHGVRQLGTYYNDAVRPDDPYEFVGLLKGERMLASQRNQSLENLARRVREHKSLEDAMRQAASSSVPQGDTRWQETLRQARIIPGGDDFVDEFEALLASFLDVAYGSERLADRPDILLQTILQMAQEPERQDPQKVTEAPPTPTVQELEQRLLYAVGEERHAEVREIIAIGRLSWRLRDDDNVLIGRLESQLLRALHLAADRLRAAGRLQNIAKMSEKASLAIVEALRDPLGGPITIPPDPRPDQPAKLPSVGESPRQLVGQPAAPGLATGRVKCIQITEDLGRFQAGEVLVCDAIQPTMTHLVPLACAVVERRGGMLIHGAIIARELGIPCVNGITNAVELLNDGELVTVDGYLGIVTVGDPEFDLEGVSFAVSEKME
ncbi:MAG: hypothetical protein GTN71_27735 [Anaerolineae bacterium]|nr:hypothetical protein [Anaerolineae bacterium]